MAFSSFGNTGGAGAGAGAGAGGISRGPPLPEVQTEGLGFLSLAGDAKLRLTSPWSPTPYPNASLVSIASRQGLVAAAGPDAVVIASTQAVRKAFESPKDGDSEIRSFEPQLKLPLPVRICQLAFTADESYLILSAEQGGGLAVYDVQALQQGSTESAFQLPTNGEALRALVPNPRPEKGELCAVVTNEGKLLMANMKERNFVQGGNGQVLKEQVSCVAWSTKGKQLVSGLGDGTLHQMTPEGVVKAEIPRPPELDSTSHVSTLLWLENDVFLAIHISTSGGSPQSICHLITRQGQSFQFQKLNDPVEPYTADTMPHHTAVRLKDFPPNLQDLLIFSSTAVPDIGLLARSKAPLSSDGPANTFTNIELADDSKRATLPMDDSMESPPPIGTALDLSSKDSVYKPIPTDEMEQSPGPLPGYWVLNGQGILSIWWVVYSESIRNGTIYPGLAAVEGNTAASVPPTAPQTTQTRAFGASSTPAFGAAPAATTPALGGSSALGAKSSPWGGQPTSASSGGTGGAAFGSSSFGTAAASTAPKFGAPSFGTSSFGTHGAAAAAPAFGQSSGPGAKSSPWASGSASSSTPAFGQSGLANNSGGSGGLFGSSAPNNAASSGGFAGFASKGGFASLGSTNSSDAPSIFASAKSSAPEVSMDADSSTSFPPPNSTATAGTSNPFGSQPFKLTSSFKPDPNAKDEDAAKAEGKPSTGEQSLFGTAFASSMNEPTGTTSNPFGSKTQSVFGQPASTSRAESTTPTATPAPSKFLSHATQAPTTGGLFSFPPKGSSSLFGSPSQTPKAEILQVKIEPQTPKPEIVPEDAPLPPESTSKAAYPLGDSSSSSATIADTPDAAEAEDVPLPSDSPVPIAKKTENAQPANATAAPANEAPLPPDPIRNKSAYNSPLPALPGVAAKPNPASGAPLPPDPIRNKKAYAGVLPPLPGVAAKPKPASEAPLPPDPVKQSTAYENKLPALPIAKPPSSVAGPGFKFPTNPLPVESDSDDDDFSDEDEATDAASEGSGVDVAKDLSLSVTGINKTPGYTPQSWFDGLAGSYSTTSRPEQERRSLFGELGRTAPVFPQPNPISPRSPSPVRGPVPARVLGKEQPRSFSAPGMASQILGTSRRPQSRLGASIVGKDAAIEGAIIEQQRKAKAKKEAEETQLLVDEEDDAVQKILRTDVEPTVHLDEFIAHSNVAPPAGDSVPAQVEAVYRDINSMIDTLGLNARSLRGFIKGHEELGSDDRARQDLASPEDWTLGDIQCLTHIIDQDLSEALDEARVIDVEEKLAEIQDRQRELARDRNKQADLKKIIASRLDPEQTVATRAQPLSAEQAAQQNDLRREVRKFLTLLATAEENLTFLKAKLVSANSANGKGGPTPTIEAVVRTITKMTSMVEKRSGDVDVLENQMRKLRLGSSGPAGSREGSPFATPKKLGSSLLFTPERSVREGSTPLRGSAMRHSLSGSVSSIGGGMFRTPPRKKLAGFGDLEKTALKENRERRTALLGKLKSSLQKKGPGVWAMDDIE
ncbi:Uu.00g015090.m01.CDS01 [Anthostomella pinea]|uniref:Uu.00g015090.m01.CDS01 n=1 Tax=Anthostomella pinea TaxID=933095 RepID=A0AAI8VZ13_9PEZI|nr:Uu.00g015090.m01.CDS01 [Anthostomella pinea]